MKGIALARREEIRVGDLVHVFEDWPRVTETRRAKTSTGVGTSFCVERYGWVSSELYGEWIQVAR